MARGIFIEVGVLNLPYGRESTRVGKKIFLAFQFPEMTPGPGRI
jgi:hypothetical protein